MRFARLLLNPWVVLASLFVGVAIGMWFPAIAHRFSLIGELYLQLLQMCVLPIMVAALFTSLARLLRTKNTMRLIGRILAVYLIGLLLSSVLGIAGGVIFQPGANLDNQSRQALGHLLTDAEQPHLDADMRIARNGEAVVDNDQRTDFFLRVVPTNIFAALAEGQTLQILFFSLLLGVAVAMAPGKATDRFIDNGEVVFQAFVKIIQWLMYLLPVGLPFLVAKQMTSLEQGMLSALLMYIGTMYVMASIGILLATIILQRCAKDTFFGTLRRCREPLILGLGTANSFACMPSSIQTLSDYRFNHTTVNLLIPMGIAMFRFGNVLLFSLSLMFLMQLYGLPIGPIQAAQLLLLPVLAGIASAGAPALVAMTMISMGLEPLGLPVEASIVMVLAVVSIVDPIMTTFTVQGNLAATALTATPAEQELESEDAAMAPPAQADPA